MRRTILAGFTAALLVFIVVPSTTQVGAEAPLYSVQDLGTLNGLVPHVTGLNVSGEASGYISDPDTGPHAARFRDGAWSYVPGLESKMSLALGINDHGDVVGYLLHESGYWRALVSGLGHHHLDIVPRTRRHAHLRTALHHNVEDGRPLGPPRRH